MTNAIPAEDIDASIIAMWQAAWTATPTAWENVAFDPHNLNAADIGAGFQNGGPWVELRVIQQPGLGQISTANNGTRRWRIPGQVIITAAVQAGQGKAALSQLLDEAAQVFRGHALDTSGAGHLLFFNSYATPAANSPKDASWYTAAAVIRFWYDYDA